jgi:hypothetical protein
LSGQRARQEGHGPGCLRTPSLVARSSLLSPGATAPAVIASTHHPFYYQAAALTGQDRPPFADEWVAKIEAFRQTLTRARPDVLVMVGSDHFDLTGN